MSIREKLFQNNFAKAVGINIVYLFIIVLCFEQFATYDDFTMAVQYASGVGEEYAAGQTFINPIYGKLVVGLNNLIPSLPWFNILFFLLSFISLTLLTFNILEMNLGRIGFVMANIISIFYAYEMYAGTCFTKVAGITAVCGVFVALNHQKKIFNLIIGLILVGVSCIIRQGLVETSVICLFLFVVVEELYHLIDEKHIYLKDFVLKCMVLAICFLIGVFVPKINFIFTDEEIDEYAAQMNENTIRATFQDYDVPSYEDYPNIYIENDITENDIKINKIYNYDRYKLTQEIYDSFTKASTSVNKSFLARVFSAENIKGFCKEYPWLFFKMDVFYALGFCVVLMLLNTREDHTRKALFNLLFVIFLNLLLMYYMYISGRYNQHRVDIAVELIMIVGYIYLNRDIVSKTSKKINWLLFSICILMLPYHFHDDFYMSVESEQSMIDISSIRDEMAEDKEHFYLLGNKYRQKDIFCLFSLWDITKDKCENRYENTSMISNFHEPHYIEKYNIKDLYKETVNSDTIRFVYDSDTEDIEKWKEYFGHRVGAKVDIGLVKQCYGKNVCLVKTQKEKWLSEDRIESAVENDKFIVDVEKEIKKKSIGLSGKAYLKGGNSFSQTMYLTIIDSETKETEVYPVFQFEDVKSKHRDDKISMIDFTVEKPDFYSEDDEFVLIVEENGKLYSKNI